MPTYSSSSVATTALANTVVTTTISAVAGDYIVVFTYETGTALTSGSVTDNASGVYTKLDSKVFGAGVLSLWIREGVLSTSLFTNVSYGPASTTNTGAAIAVVRVLGTKAASTRPVRQFASSDGAGGATPSLVFSNAPLTANAILLCICNTTNPANVSAPASFFFRQNAGSTTPLGLGFFNRDSGQTSATITFGSTSASTWAAVAIEVMGTVHDTVHHDFTDRLSLTPAGGGSLNFEGLISIFPKPRRIPRKKIPVIEVFQNTATTIMALMTSATTDRGLAGESSTMVIWASKVGGVFVNITSSCTITDRGFGQYAIAIPASVTDTMGIVQFHITSTNTYPNDEIALKVIDKAYGQFTIGTVVSDASNTVVSFKTNLVQVTLDYWRDVYCTMIDGNYAEQTKKVTGYNGTTFFLTVKAPGFTGTPAPGDRFFLVNK